MASVTLQGVSKSYGDVTALRTMDLEIADGEFSDSSRGRRAAARQRHSGWLPASSGRPPAESCSAARR